jgi:hypothetical protein
METMHYETVNKVLTKLNKENLDLDVKLMKAAEILHLKLEKEKDINEFIDLLKVVPNYKTIKKSVAILEEKVKTSKELEVQLEPDILAKVNATTSRLIAERNLQFQMEKVSVSKATHDDVSVLEDLIHKAKATEVSNMYTDQADIYLDKMKKNIRAREILELLEAYPPREYPEVEEPDPKNKNKKPAEPPKKKKKKKKEPPFPMPDWAQDLETLKSEVDNLKELLGNRDNLELNDEFNDKCIEQFDRFYKKEIPFRRDQEEQERLAKEAKLAKKGKGKK